MRVRGLLFVTALGVAFAPMAARAQVSLVLGDELRLPAHEGSDAYGPAVAYGATTYLIVWQAGRLMNGDLVALRLDAAGMPLDLAPFVVSAANDDQERASVAFGQGVFLVVWQDLRNRADYDVRAARVSPAGEVLDAEGILVSGGVDNQASPCVTFDGTDFLVAFESWKAGLYEIAAARVSADGLLLDPTELTVASAPANQWPGFHRLLPAVASAGDGSSLVLWHGGAHWWEGRGSTWGGVFVQNGVVGQALDYSAVGTTTSTPGAASVFSVAAGPDSWLVTWRNLARVGRGNPSTDANMALLAKDGAASGTRLLLGTPQAILDPSTVFDGVEYLTAWGEQESASPPSFDRVLMAATSATDGTPLGAAVLVAGTYESPARHVAVASDGACAGFVVYERHPVDGADPIVIGVRRLAVQ